MSPSDKPDTARGWQFVEKLLADDDIERLDQASDEEVERQMQAQGVQGTGVPTAEELIAQVAKRAGKRASQPDEAPSKVRDIRRMRVVAWLAAAAIGAVAVAIVVKQQENPGVTSPPRDGRAEPLRREAFAACGQADWTLCESKLDEARQWDPQGEAEPRVQAARQQIDRALHAVEAGQLQSPGTK